MSAIASTASHRVANEGTPQGVPDVSTASDSELARAIPTIHDVFLARRRIARYLNPTPVLSPPALSERLGMEISLKAECLNPTRSFKVRGGINLMSSLAESGQPLNVVSASTGNHGQSIAYAARVFGGQATIFVPEGANPLKVASMERLGAPVIHAGKDFDACLVAATTYAAENGLHFVHSANEPRLIEGVATYSLEFLEAVPDLDVLIVPAGGGSGLSGACIVGKAISPKLQIIGVQAVGAPAIYESWKRRELVSFDSMSTFAEGIATRVAFELPARIIWKYVDDIVLVSDDDLRRGIVTLLETTGLLAEGAGAAALAAAHAKRDAFAGKRVGIVVSGGNLSFDSMRQILAEAEPW